MRGVGVYGGGGRGRLYTYRYTVTTRMIPALKMGSDESHFNVSLMDRSLIVTVTVTVTSVRDSHKTGVHKPQRF